MEKKTTKEKEIKYETFVIHTAKFKTLLTEKFINRKQYVPKDLGLVISLIPGSVLKTFVKKGSKVKKGDLLIELEAMKMINKILAPMDGTVKQLNVTEGVRIPKNHLIAEIR